MAANIGEVVLGTDARVIEFNGETGGIFYFYPQYSLEYCHLSDKLVNYS